MSFWRRWWHGQCQRAERQQAQRAEVERKALRWRPLRDGEVPQRGQRVLIDNPLGEREVVFHSIDTGEGAGATFVRYWRDPACQAEISSSNYTHIVGVLREDQ